MSPDTVAEKVIKAIEEDVFYIITHPDYLPYIQERFDRMNSDSVRLNKHFPEKKTGIITKRFDQITPTFSITYPDNWIEMKPPINIYPNLIFTASFPGQSLEVWVTDVPPNTLLESATKIWSDELKNFVKEVKIVADNQTTLNDGTPANEGLTEHLTFGYNIKMKSIHLSTFKDNKWISVHLYTLASIYHEDLKKIVYSLEFK